MIALLFLNGCAGIVKELAQDPAIVVSTGFWLSFGLNPAMEVGGMPLPNIKIGYGTLTRIGGNRDVTMTVGTATDIKQGEQGGIAGAAPAKGISIPTLGSRASLHITAKNSEFADPPKIKKSKKQKAKVKDVEPTAPVPPPGK